MFTNWENTWEKKRFITLKNLDWRPFDNLLSIDRDYPEGDWEYGKEKLCSDFLSEIQSFQIENAYSVKEIREKDHSIVIEIKDYLKEYNRNKKKEENNFIKSRLKDIDQLSETSYEEIFDFIVSNERIKQTSRPLFISGNYRNAVLDAFIQLEMMVKEKLGDHEDKSIQDLSTTKLMRKVFNIKQPILCWNNLETLTEKKTNMKDIHISLRVLCKVLEPQKLMMFFHKNLFAHYRW